MIPKNRIPTHPGEILLEDFMRPMEVTQTELAEHLSTSVQRVNELINGKRGVTPDTAWLLAGAFGTTAQFWINLQTNYDLATHKPAKAVKLIRPMKAAG
jgi:addiction module HigA family antidote